jgi:hypothetical protein
MKATVILLLLFLLASCEGKTFKGNTPKAYLNKSKPSEAVYRQDTAMLRTHLSKLLAAHQDFFSNSAYDSSTELLIDTIVYSPDFNKGAVLVITKNPTSQQLIPDTTSAYYFDGTSFLVMRKDSLLIEWLGPSFSNSNNQKALSREMRDYFFHLFADKDTTKRYSSPYNFDDKRFWHTSVWEKFR